MPKNMKQMRRGRRGRIKRMRCQPWLKKRLFSLGVREGKEIEMVKEAPLNDPLEIAVGQSHVCVRKTDAELIEMEFEEDDHV